MGVKLENMTNYLRWILGLLIMALAVYGNSYYSYEPLLYRVIGVIILLLISLAILLTTSQGKEALNTVLESRIIFKASLPSVVVTNIAKETATKNITPKTLYKRGSKEKYEFPKIANPIISRPANHRK